MPVKLLVRPSGIKNRREGFYYLNILIVFLLIQPGFAQWEAGGSFNFKNEAPKTGIELYVGRNLPFQWATIGLKIRGGIDLYISKNNKSIVFTNEDIHFDLIATLFYRYTSPYFGLIIGAGHYSVNDFNRFIFFPGILVGIKFPFSDRYQPYIEITAIKYLSSFDIKLTRHEISSFQFTGKAGVIIRF